MPLIWNVLMAQKDGNVPTSGGPMIATKILAPMGSPWHSLIYFPFT